MFPMVIMPTNPMQDVFSYPKKLLKSNVFLMSNASRCISGENHPC